MDFYVIVFESTHHNSSPLHGFLRTRTINLMLFPHREWLQTIVDLL